MPRLLDELDVFRGPFAVDGTIRTCLVERKKLIYRGEGNQFDSFSC